MRRRPRRIDFLSVGCTGAARRARDPLGHAVTFAVALTTTALIASCCSDPSQRDHGAGNVWRRDRIPADARDGFGFRARRGLCVCIRVRVRRRKRGQRRQCHLEARRKKIELRARRKLEARRDRIAR